MGHYMQLTGDPDTVNRVYRLYDRVTGDDIMMVTQKYFGEHEPNRRHTHPSGTRMTASHRSHTSYTRLGCLVALLVLLGSCGETGPSNGIGLVHTDVATHHVPDLVFRPAPSTILKARAA